MRTLVISDLHLGGRTGVDILRRPEILAVLLAEVVKADRLVLLGDTLELRHGPAREALAAARPVLEALGETLPAGREVVLVPGNHDHALASPWLDAHQRPLGLETRVRPGTASPIARHVGGWLAGGGADIVIAYPGVWLRADVYATHGHYLDPHGTVPTFERIAAGVMERLAGPVPAPAVAEDYERVLAPLYAWITSAAQRATQGRPAAGAGRAGKAYTVLQGGDGHRPVRARALAAAFPLGIRGLNLLGIGPVSGDLSGGALRRSALRGMTEVVERLDLEAEHVVFGHSHRPGPLPADELTEWRTPGGTWLHNTGSWVHEPSFTGSSAGSAPYWPGGAVVVEDDDEAGGPPRLLRLLADVSLPPVPDPA
jgi:Calcineurin-like phosphoesterase